MPKIAISYRRSDGSAVAGRIYDRLAVRYGAQSVFMDVEKIPLGVDFRDYIKSVLLRSDILLAIVGPHWCVAADGAPRLADAEDPVRIEIETGLQQRKRIIPVLIDGATMPLAAHLPESLRPFRFLNAASIEGGRDFGVHMDRLIAAIDGRDGAMQSAPKWSRRTGLVAGSAFGAAVVLAGAWLVLGTGLVARTPAPPHRAPDQAVLAQAGTTHAPEREVATGGPLVAPIKMYRVVSKLSDDVLNLRPTAGARLDNPPLVAIPAGSPGISLGACRRLDDGEPWCPATWKNQSGWLNARFVIEVDTTAAPSESAKTPSDKIYQVAGGIAEGMLHIRRAPNTAASNPPFASIPEGTSGIRLGPCLIVENAKWCLATWQGRSGWVDERFLVPAETPRS